MQDEHEEFCFPDRLSPFGHEFLSFSFNIFLQLADGVVECRTGVIDLVHDQDIFAYQAGHF